MDLQDLLADSVLASGRLLHRYLPGFDDSNYTRTAPGLPNHVAWCLGHCAMTMHRGAERIDSRPLPETDFASNASRTDRERYGTESVATGSWPSDGTDDFPPFPRCCQIFNSAIERLAATLRSATTQRLMETSMFFGGAELPLWHTAPRIVFHNGTHCGQIADLRRALGLPRLFG